MKKFKKLISLMVAVAMLLALSVTAFAEETQKFTITLTGTQTSPTNGHSYEIYQIFTGDLEEKEDGSKILKNVKYGLNYSPDAFDQGDAVTDRVLMTIKDMDANVFADSIIDKLEGNEFGVLTATNNYQCEVPAGYYLIVDVTDGDKLDELLHTRSAYIVQVVGNIDMAPKSGVVDVVKKLKDINDSVDADIEDNAWQDSADHDINDVIPYDITSNINSIGDFAAYEVKFVDTMSKGLTYNNDAVITLEYTAIGKDGSTITNTVDVTENFTITEADCTDTEGKYVGGKVYTFAHTNIKALVKEEGANITNAKITIDYTTTLNENAVIGEAGNPNKVHLEYDRNPEDDEMGITPDDVNIVFTFKADVNKVDQNNEPLTGAEFTLEKFVAKEEGATIYKTVEGEWTSITCVKNDAGTVFSFKGLDDGEYRITETVTPNGYNPIEPIYFTVTAEHDVEAADPQLTNLEADIVKADGTAYTEEELLSGDIAKFVVTKSEGNMATTVVNNAGVELPSTGGIGTTIFYIIGAILVIGACVILITRKRMNVEK